MPLAINQHNGYNLQNLSKGVLSMQTKLSYGAILLHENARTHTGTYDPEIYSKEHDEQYYQRMLEEIGFNNVRYKKELTIICYPLNENCKAHLLELYLTFFKKPSENVNEIKEELFKIYKETVDRHKGKLCYRIMLLKLFGVQPT
ncbi:hypothetical protein TNCT_155651 [Trichonephila clavata]|uniref:Uncharacterized protein n=1 Tax=Trichonephila clavata TaxID=2740835 RepID=A0A8X6JAW6_TRICU|nr:hypothetical protein TNCT_155651 [Trichonephila clavata]